MENKSFIIHQKNYFYSDTREHIKGRKVTRYRERVTLKPIETMEVDHKREVLDTTVGSYRVNIRSIELIV